MIILFIAMAERLVRFCILQEVRKSGEHVALWTSATTQSLQTASECNLSQPQCNI